jgi:hypothetical protein
MTENPLEKHLQAFETAAAALKVVRLLLKKQRLREVGIEADQARQLLNETKLSNLDAEDIRTRVSIAEEELRALTIIGLFATFEKTLRNHLKLHLERLETINSNPSELMLALKTFLEGEAIWWNTEKIIELFSPPVDSTTKGQAKQAKDYRDYVAHRMREAAAVLPNLAHEQLTDFLTQAKILASTETKEDTIATSE